MYNLEEIKVKEIRGKYIFEEWTASESTFCPFKMSEEIFHHGNTLLVLPDAFDLACVYFMF